MQKIKVRATLVSGIQFGIYSVTEFMEQLKGHLSDLNAEERKSARFNEERYGYDNTPEFSIVYDRLETDAEFERRRKAEEAAKSKETERALFERLERLKKKYG